MSLRPYQSEAKNAVRASWQEHQSALLVMCTGSGKTFTASSILEERAQHGRTLWLAHRGELLDQARQTLEERSGLRCDIEKADAHAAVCGRFNDTAVVVASVQSLRGKRLARFPRDSFATVVVDEAHHAPAKTYRNILDHFEGAKVLGLTATPDRGDGVAMGHVFDDVAYEYGIRRAIEEGYLCPIIQQSIECDDLDLADIRTVCGDLNQGQLEAVMKVDAVLHQVAKPLVELAGPRQTIVFTVGVDQARALTEVLGGYLGDTSAAEYLTGETPQDERRRILERYRKGEVQFLLNCAVLTEGFDAPETACIAVARPTKSRALYTQMLGRGTRIAEGKEDCLILDFVGNAGKHTLVNPLDVLGGKALPSAVKEIAEELVAQGKPTMLALIEAEQKVKQRLEAERERRARAKKVRANVRYRSRSVDPFGLLGVKSAPGWGTASQPQLAYLASKGVKFGEPPTKREASQLIDRLIVRQREGLCTFLQGKLLAKKGLPSNLPFKAANEAITAIANNGWRTPDWLRAQYAQEAAE